MFAAFGRRETSSILKVEAVVETIVTGKEPTTGLRLARKLISLVYVIDSSNRASLVELGEARLVPLSSIKNHIVGAY